MAYSPLILIAVEDFNSIRSLLGVTAEEISDDEIKQPPYLPYVEAQVVVAIPDYASLGEADTIFLKTGVMCWTAGRLCHLLAGKAAAGTFAKIAASYKLSSYEQRGAGGTIVKMDYRQKADELARQTVEALGSISTLTYSVPSPLLLAGPTRSGSGTPSTSRDWLNKIIPDVVEWSE